MRFLPLTVFTFALVHVGSTQETETSMIPESANLTIMTWNILAPIWVERNTLEQDGVDLNLLDEDNRVIVTTQEILKRRPDVLTLQEVQEDVFNKLKVQLSPFYTPVAFAPNIKGYWKSFLPEGVPYVKNGVATFVNSRTVGVDSHSTFETSPNGSIALTSVLYSKLPASVGRGRSLRGSPFIVINAHHESGFTEADSYVRVAQGTVIMNEASRVQAEISEKSPNGNPFVVIAGDFNSQFPFPGIVNYKSNGYLDALETAGDPSQQTYFYANPVPLPTGDAFATGATIDHIMFKLSDVMENRVAPVSATIPDISSSDLTEASYVGRLTKVVTNELRRRNIREAYRVVSVILPISTDNNDYDTDVNRALRLGSDHLPLIVNVRYAV